MRGQDGAECVSVYVVDLAACERLARLDDFVASRKDRHAWLAEHFERIATDRRDCANAAWVQQIAAAHH